MEFFSELPGVTYQYARYTDWIQPFLTSQMNKSAAGVSTTFSNEEIVKIMSKFETYQAYLSEKDKNVKSADVEADAQGVKSKAEASEKVNEEEKKEEAPEEDKKENVEMVEICGTMIPASDVVGAS